MVNAEKSIIAGSTKIEFVGYKIKQNSIKPMQKKHNVISDFKIPESRTDLRCFVSLASGLEKFSPNLAKTMEPLRDLLKTWNEFKWYADHMMAFNKVKKLLTSTNNLAMYNPKKQTCLDTDASRTGLGFVLSQKQGIDKVGNKIWKWIQAGSRFLTNAETRYAMVELEALAVYYAIKKCQLFLAGTDFEVLVDHKPLLPMFNQQLLPHIENPQVQNYQTKLANYRFKLVWKKGSTHCVPDNNILIL